MYSPQLHVAVIGAGEAGLSCALHLQSDACTVTVFDAARVRVTGGMPVQSNVTIFDIWHDDGWRVASLEHGAHHQRFDALVLAMPALKAAELLEPLLPMTALRASSMAPRPAQCIWVPAVQIGLCGGWLCGGQDGDAWLSGRALAARLLDQLGMDQNSAEAVSAKVRGAPSTR